MRLSHGLSGLGGVQSCIVRTSRHGVRLMTLPLCYEVNKKTVHLRCLFEFVYIDDVPSL